jgi:hypothetical protein
LVAAVAAIALFSGLYNALGPRDEQSYQAGREAGSTGDTMIKFAGGTPEEFCKNQFNLSTMGNRKSDLRRRDFMAGCLDVVEEEMRAR